jgi:hypothetical protein
LIIKRGRTGQVSRAFFNCSFYLGHLELDILGDDSLHHFRLGFEIAIKESDAHLRLCCDRIDGCRLQAVNSEAFLGRSQICALRTSGRCRLLPMHPFPQSSRKVPQHLLPAKVETSSFLS